MKENLLGGIIGAVLGAVLGGILWILVGQLGYISGVAGLIIVLCSIKGYQILGKSISRKGILICILLSLVIISLAEYVSNGILIYQAYKTDGATLKDGLQLVPEMWKYPELRNGMIQDLAVGYIFAAVSSFASIRRIWKANKKN